MERFRRSPIGGVGLRQDERFCAVALVKRFAEPAFFAKKLRLLEDDRRIPDAATIAASSGSPMPVSRAILSNWKAESGSIGLRRSSTKMNRRFPRRPGGRSKLQGTTRELALRRPILPCWRWTVTTWAAGFTAKIRPRWATCSIRTCASTLRASGYGGGPGRAPAVGPAMHAAISEALTNFAVHVAPRIVEKHWGTLIYCGGDDLLALLPAGTALACAHELRLAFSGDPRVNGGAAAATTAPAAGTC